MFANAGWSRKRAQLRSNMSLSEAKARTSTSGGTPSGYESSQIFRVVVRVCMASQ